MKILRLFRNWDDRQEFDAKAVIFSEREPAEDMYVVLDGEVQLSIQGQPLGREAEGGIIGEMAMLDSNAHSSTATAITAVTLARLGRAEFRRYIRENPEFSLHAMAVLANRLRAIDDFITTRLE